MSATFEDHIQASHYGGILTGALIVVALVMAWALGVYANDKWGETPAMPDEASGMEWYIENATSTRLGHATIYTIVHRPSETRYVLFEAKGNCVGVMSMPPKLPWEVFEE